MLKVGLTGGIGSGKSTVAGFFAEHNVPIIDTDKIAHALTQPGTGPFKKIVAHFGDEIVKEDGSINRAKLRVIIFENEAEREWLEALLHPPIIKEMNTQMAALNAPYCILVIPLLTEAIRTFITLDRILVVDTPVELQIERAIHRDKLTEEQARAIIRAQSSREDRLALADDVIVNDKSIEALHREVEKLHAAYSF